jgi:hypothetical protein
MIMPSTKFLFTVPEDHQRIAEIICDEGGTLEYENPFDTYDEAEAFLSEWVGKVITAEFEDVDDTLDPLYALADELDTKSAPYLGVADAFEERSRGTRVDGSIVFNLFGDDTERMQIFYPWSNGDPETDVRTLRTAGVTEDAISMIAERLMPPSNKEAVASPHGKPK